MNDPSQPQSPFTRPSFLISAVVVLLLIIAGLIVALTGGKDSPPQAEPSTPTDTTTSPGKSDSTCDLPAGTQRVLTSAPPTNWSLVGRIATPNRKDVGPGRTTGDVRSCFSHGAEGALFAAANVGSELAAASDPTRIINERIAPGPGRDQALQLLQASTAPPEDDSSTRVQYAAFRFDNYSADRATVQIVARGAADSATEDVLVAITYTMVWQDGDWKAELPVSGQANSNTLNSLDGYVEWSGV